MDEELEADPQRAALEEVIRILAPLRQHRQASAERQQRQAERELDSGRERLAQTRSAFADERSRQVEQRQALALEHVNQALTLNDVDRWHDQERSLLDDLSRLRQGIDQQTRAVQAQQQTLKNAQRDAKAAQRAVEKLACLAEAINDEN
ncbi:type III secretion system stalk subunit SctO [Pseudomonas typographi]|uniref:YscO family type III secretion system apparatus protein n=1 Tax=Pseudomonas typographi TaxID=2715964 RepID=A0ABR7Z743_9PSED|nr:YscO family type III secretion system apparatus protein [Pseudomonas typographi]MBD1601361.1 YscO family type III secretion system apparatus protein [Pseudomonas typographi]